MGRIKMPQLETQRILLKRQVKKKKKSRKDKMFSSALICRWYIRCCKDATFIGFRLSTLVGVRLFSWLRRKSFLWFCNHCSAVDTNPDHQHSLSHNIVQRMPARPSSEKVRSSENKQQFSKGECSFLLEIFQYWSSRCGSRVFEGRK